MSKREAQQVAPIGSVCARHAAYAAAFVCALMLAQPSQAQPHSQSSVMHAQAVAKEFSTQFTLDLSASISAEVYTLAAPYRVIIDMPDASSNLNPVQTATGVVASYRTELLRGGGARLIITTTGPVEVAAADWVAADGPKSASTARLQLTLKSIDKSAFGKGTGAGAGAGADFFPAAAQKPLPSLPAAATLAKSPVKPALFDDAVPQPQDRPSTKPVIIIDPGHGGIDPGAIGPDKVTEKTIVLAVANQAKAALDATGRYDVRLTRTTDVFIPLDSRVAISKQAKADIFISLHADTIENRQLARTVRGASVYTLSDKASNEDARLMAEKENAADLVAGITPRQGDAGDDIKPILFDLMARETATFSRLLSRSVITSLRKNHPMAHEPERAAAFRVLRQPHAPSVLIELGFLSNPDESQLMNKSAWQKQTGAAIASAVDTYFSRKASTMAPAPFEADFGGLPP